MLRRPARRLGALVLLLSLLVALLVGAAALFPAYSGVLQPPFAVFVAMRRLALLGALLLASCALLAALLTPSGRRLRIAAGVITVLLAVPLTVTVASGTASAAPPTSTTSQAITVLSWNTGQDRVPQAAIDRLVRTVAPDVIVLPEYFGSITGGLAIAHSKRYRMYSWDASTSSIFISTRLGPYRLDTRTAPTWAGFTLRPSRIDSPQITVAHLQRPSLTDGTTWRQHLDWITSTCTTPDAIAVGDFNAAPENLPATRLGSCTDAATTLHASTTGTWPTLLPPGLGTQIDHAYLGSNWTPTRFTVIGTEDHAGSDHRPIVLTIHRK